MTNVSFAEFNSVLNTCIKERFPDTAVRILHGGDFAIDVEMELTQGNSKFTYRPYELYSNEDSYEENIDYILTQWDLFLGNAGE